MRIRALMCVLLATMLTSIALTVAPSSATYRGKNGLLVYQAAAGKHAQVFTLHADGTGVRQLTHFRDSDAIAPSWSPDARRLAFARDYAQGTPGEHIDIYTMNADGSGLRALGLHGLNGTPTWSPDGHLLWVRPDAFAVSNADGTGRRLIRIPGVSGSPTFSPDGKRIAFVRASAAVMIVDADGTHLRRLTAPAGGVADKIDWAPDGSRILFSAPAFGGTRSSNVFTIRPNGSGLRKLTHSSGGRVANGADSWSPDGKQIVFISNRGSSFRMYLMTAAGRDVRLVSHDIEGHLAAWGMHP